MFLPLWKEEGNRKRFTSSSDCRQRSNISPAQWVPLEAQIQLFIFAFFQKGVVPSIISKFRSNFHKKLLGSARQLTDLHGHLGKMEAFHLPGFLLRSSIAQRESDCSKSVQFALIMRQLDRDTTAVTLPGVRRDSLIRIGCIFQLNQCDVYHILIFLRRQHWTWWIAISVNLLLFSGVWDGDQALRKGCSKRATGMT